jgi:hypothetical protein
MPGSRIPNVANLSWPLPLPQSSTTAGECAAAAVRALA